MPYRLLSKLYYHDKNEYNALYEQRKNSETTTFFPFKIHSHDAFYCLCPEIYSLSTDILRLDKEISAVRSALPEVALMQFRDKCLIDEIKLTNDIEGVYSTRKEIAVVLDELSKGNKKSRFYGLVKKYSMLNHEPFSLISCSDIRNIYDELVLPEIIADCPDNAPDGTIFRKDPAEVTTQTQKVIHRGVYPENNIILHMEQALSILNDRTLPILIRISVFHYLFGYIHPFYDGNGRTSRFISSQLLSREFEYLIGYRLSYTVKENIKEYYEAFNVCNDAKNLGDLTPFIIVFLKIILEAFEKLHDALVTRQLALDKYYEQICRFDEFTENFKREFCYVLLQVSLFSNKGISKKGLCEIFDISQSTVDKRLAKVRNSGLLKETKGERAILYSLDLEKLSE